MTVEIVSSPDFGQNGAIHHSGRRRAGDPHSLLIKSDLDKTGRNVDSSIVRQPSGSIRSTNSSISVIVCVQLHVYAAALRHVDGI